MRKVVRAAKLTAFCLGLLVSVATTCLAEGFLDFMAWHMPLGPLLPVEINNKWGYIDRTGKLVVEPRFRAATDFADGMAVVALGDWRKLKYGYVEATGKVAIEPSYEEVQGFSEGLAAVRVGDQWGYIDKAGEFAIEPQFARALPFDGGVALVALGAPEATSDDPMPWLNEAEYALIDKSGARLATRKMLPFGYFSDGLAMVGVGDKVGYMDRSGRMAIPPIYHDAAGFSEGLAAVSAGEEWDYKEAYIDKAGKLVIEPRFQWARPFSEGLAAVALGSIDEPERWGFIDQRGKTVVKPVYHSVESFSEGLAAVTAIRRRTLRTGFIDRTGRMVIRLRFRGAGHFREGLAEVHMIPEGGAAEDDPYGDTKSGFIDRKGKVVIPAQFDDVSVFCDGIARVWFVSHLLGGKFSYIDKTGEFIWKAEQ